jgi:superfamily I DNA/RNA helicase
VFNRYTKKAYFGPLTNHLQEELAKRNVPFHVVGGKTLFERETVADLLSYLRLCVGADDESTCLQG